jgi:H+/Na+-translocating ferredoxin:NAD+ oxidoreductase subunit B
MADDLYRQLQQHLDRMPIPFPATESGVEIRILKRLYTPEDARLTLCVSAIPEPPETILKRLKHTGMDLRRLRKTLDRMADEGLIERLRVKGKTVYGKSPLAIGIYERQVNRLTPELERDVRQYMREQFGEALFSAKTPQLRTIPVNKSITPERSVATYDNIREVVRRSDGPFATMNCICRQGKDLTGESCQQTEVRENCLTIGEAARSMVDRDVAHFITRAQMLELLEKADEEGLVLQPQNTQDPLFVCCCCGCCCGVLTTAKLFPKPAEFFQNNYYVAVDSEKCEICGTCETRCQMDAISTESGACKVDLDHCIGCGLCVTTCPSEAIQLRQHERPKTPPETTKALYVQIFKERYGPWNTARLVGRKILGMKI